MRDRKSKLSNVRGDRGQTLVEFALVLPLLAVLLFGIVQFGIVYNNWVTLTDAVRAGARVAAVSRQTTDPSGPAGVATQATVTAGSDISLKASDVTVTSTWQPGSTVTVQAVHPYSLNILGIVVASGTFTSKTTERVE